MHVRCLAVAAGLSVRKNLRGTSIPFCTAVASLIVPSAIGVCLFGLMLSWNELLRPRQAIVLVNTFAPQLQGVTTTVAIPDIYALGTLISVVSFIVIALFLGFVFWL